MQATIDGLASADLEDINFDEQNEGGDRRSCELSGESVEEESQEQNQEAELNRDELYDGGKKDEEKD